MTIDLQEVAQIVDDSVGAENPNACRFDHHGYCQEHGWFSTDECYVPRAHRLLEKLKDLGYEAR